MNSKQTDRRRFLQGGAAMVGLAAGGLTPARAQEILPQGPIVPAGVRRLGELSPYEKSYRVGTAASALTPLQDSHGIITPSALHFYVNHEYGVIPVIDPKKYRLLIHGLVERPVVLTLDEIRRLPSISRIYFIECNGNGNLGRRQGKEKTAQDTHGRTSCSEWTGIPLSLLLKEVGVKKAGSWVVAVSQDTANHAISIPMEKAMDDILVAFGQNGETLRLENGYPVRLVVPGWGGRIHVKWLNQLKVVDQPYLTTQDRASFLRHSPAGEGVIFTLAEQGRKYRYELFTRSIITFPSGGHKLPGRGLYEITGLAWSGAGKVRRVEVSTDGGRTWKDSELQKPILSKAHTRFRFLWNWNGEETVLQSRTTDEFGDVQPSVHEAEKNWTSDMSEACANAVGVEDCSRVPRRANRALIQPWRVARDGTVDNAFQATPEILRVG